MVVIDFGEHGGGKRGFQDAAELLAYFDARRSEWTALNLQSLGRELNQLPSAWAHLKTEVEDLRSRDPDNLARLGDRIHQSGHYRQLATVDSEVGQAIIEIAQEFGAANAIGAMRYFLASDGDQIFNAMRRDAVEGALMFRDRMAGVSNAKSRAARAALTRLKSDLADDVLAHRQKLDGFADGYQQEVSRLGKERKEDKEAWDQWRTDTGRNIAGEFSGWKAQWEELYHAFTEKLALEAPVKLWNDRADKHERRAGSLQLWVAGIGIVGIVIAVGVAAVALNFGHWLLAGYSGKEDGLSPAELIFAASASLLYLTLYFWTMRIVVRMYMTEQHLGIDARSRAAMAQTYLALTKEQAATDQDRAIVLGSMFRPVVDGIVKDDGLPAITPAAILAGLVGGKAQH